MISNLFTGTEPSTVHLSFLEWVEQEELARQRAVVQARRYFDGQHPTFLTERAREFLNIGADIQFSLNLCRTLVTAVAERLLLSGIRCADDEQQRWLDRIWRHNRLDEIQNDVHEIALRDGEAFVLVDWDDAAQMPRLTVHPRYTDAQIGGDGFGCRAYYPDDDYNRQLHCVAKRWTEKLDGGRARERTTVYYDERIDKFARNGSTWIPVRDLYDEQWPLAWRDHSGAPLGIPVVHFTVLELRSELWDAIPLQNAINKLLVDMLVAADVTAFRLFVALGWIPTTDGKPPSDDGSNTLRLSPGSIICTSRKRDEVDFRAIDGADMSGFLEMLNALMVWMATVSGIPATRFQFTRQVVAEGTLKEQSEPLLARVRKYQIRFGNAWERVFYIARRLWNVRRPQDALDDVAYTALWSTSRARDDKSFWDMLDVKRNKLGVPLEQIWREGGYTQEEIDQMRQSDEYQARVAMLRTGLRADG